MRPVHLLNSRSSISSFSVLPLVVASALAWTALLSLRANASEKISANHPLLTASAAQNWVAQAPSPKTSPPPAAAPEPAPDAAAEETPAEPSAGALAGPSADETEVVTIPRSSAIIVSFPAELTLDPKRRNNVPITLPLLQPIVDTDGQIVAPAKSLVSAQLKAMKGGDLIEVIAVVVGGRVIPINAMGTLVPAQNKAEDVAAQFSNASPSRLNNVIGGLQTWQQDVSYSGSRNPRINAFDLLGLGLAVGFGATSPVTKLPPPFVSITQGSVYILTLATPVTIPKRLVETGIQIRESLGEEGTIPTAQ